MLNDSLLRPRIRFGIGVSGALLTGFAVITASAKPEQQPSFQVSQNGEAIEQAPMKLRPRRPTTKAPAQAATKSDTPSISTPPSPTVSPAIVPSDAATLSTTQGAAAAVTEPVRHARDAKLGRCAAMVTKASSSTIDTAHAAVSTWSQKGSDDHMFQSIVALSYSNTIAPKAATVLVAAPEGAGCEATTVQVYPTTRSCGDIENDLKKSGRTMADFGGVPMTQEDSASRHLLLPAPGAGCVVVAVGLALNQ